MDHSVLSAYEAGTQKLRAKELTLISKAIKVLQCALIHEGGHRNGLSGDEEGRAICRWYDY